MVEIPEDEGVEISEDFDDIEETYNEDTDNTDEE